MKTSTSEIIADIEKELDAACRKFPSWPADPLHALAVLGEEYGELVRAALQRTYDRNVSAADVRAEAIQVAAMAIRFIRAMPHYDFAASEQARL